MSNSGKIIMRNGLKIQWGIKSENTYDIAFPLIFTLNCMYFNYIANKNRSTENGWHYYHSLTKSSVKVMSYDESALWFAIGY